VSWRFLGALEKLQKTVISFFMSVRRCEKAELLDGILWNILLGTLIGQEKPILVTVGQQYHELSLKTLVRL
jgi:hypothetical protein